GRSAAPDDLGLDRARRRASDSAAVGAVREPVAQPVADARRPPRGERLTMGDARSIAAVTATLRTLIAGAVDVVPGAQVTTVRPNLLGQEKLTRGVNIFLSRVTPDATMRNQQLPTRRQDGSLAAAPQVALDLHYVFTFYGDDTKLEPQLLLGAVVL